jgi:hypothetical protein
VILVKGATPPESDEPHNADQRFPTVRKRVIEASQIVAGPIYALTTTEPLTVPVDAVLWLVE